MNNQHVRIFWQKSKCRPNNQFSSAERLNVRNLQTYLTSIVQFRPSWSQRSLESLFLDHVRPRLPCDEELIVGLNHSDMCIGEPLWLFCQGIAFLFRLEFIGITRLRFAGLTTSRRYRCPRFQNMSVHSARHEHRQIN